MKKELNMPQSLMEQAIPGGGQPLNSNDKAFYRSLNLKNIFDFKKPEKKKTAFTLAETMIVIVVLGIIATLTIPALVNKNKESVAKTKLRKAMAAYESAINKMIIENDLKSDTTLTEWGNITNCTNSTNYFKKSKDINGCIFKTSDGVWWNISDIERPVISFKEINVDNAATITTNANNANDKTAFVLVGRFGTDGSLRVDDLAYETGNSETVNNYKSYDQVAKLYNFINNVKEEDNRNTTNQESDLAKKCKSGELTCTKKTLEDTEISEYSWGDELCIWDSETNQQTCPYTSKAESGDYYFTEPASYSDYISYHDEESSTCQDCKDDGYPDTYNAAKRFCEAQGGRLPTIAELKAGGYTDGYFWAAEERASNDAYVLYGGNVYNGGKTYNATDVVCVGN